MRLPQQVLSTLPKTSMSLCDEFKILEQSKADTPPPKKRQSPELSGEASHSVGRSRSPILSRGRKCTERAGSRSPSAAQKLRGPEPADALLRGLCSRLGPGSAGAGPSREHEQPP